MIFYFNVCLRKTDKLYFTCPIDFIVNYNWEKIIEVAQKEYNGSIVNEFNIVFEDENSIKQFMNYFIHLYTK